MTVTHYHSLSYFCACVLKLLLKCTIVYSTENKKKKKLMPKKGIVTDHLYRMMNISVLMGMVSSRMTAPLLTGDKGYLKTLMRKKIL